MLLLNTMAQTLSAIIIGKSEYVQLHVQKDCNEEQNSHIETETNNIESNA